jgi:hypothetical protein
MAPGIAHFQFSGNALEKHSFHSSFAKLQHIGTAGFFEK